MEKRRVVITGIGAITPVGKTIAESWDAVRRGACGIAPITQFDASAQKVKLAAEVKDFDPDAYLEHRDARKMDRFTQFTVAAADAAWADSGLDRTAEDLTRCGVLVASGIGGISTLQNECLKGAEKGYDRVSPFFIPMIISNMAAGQVAIRLGLQGMCSCVVTACASGTNAVGDAFRHVRDGYAEVMVCGGAEASITSLGMGGFTAIKALTTCDDPNRASIPFDRERSGFVMGEGAAILVLEELEHAKARGAHIYAELMGYAANCDAYHITAPAPGGEGAARCMRLALSDAGIAPEQIGYINAHGTSTHMNDLCETAAVKAVFGENPPPVSSTKSITGHMMAGAGAVEAAFTALALRDGFLPPTIHYQVPDEECDLDVVPNQGRSAEIRCALSNSLGFGGHNATVVLGRWEEG